MVSIAVRSIVGAAVCLAVTTTGAIAAGSPASAPARVKPARGEPSAPRAGAGKPGAAKARKPPPLVRNGPVELFSVNGKETLFLRLRDEKGRPLKGVQKRFDHFLRCHHTNVQHAMNPRLVRLLYQVGRHYPGRRVEVVSGYRHPSAAKNPRSPHMQGLACDFRIAGVRNQELRDYLRRDYQKVGVGYYPNSSFIHLDVRKDRSAFWIDYSGPGERAMYAENPVADLKTGRADAYKPLTIDKDWANDADQDGDTGRQPSPDRTSPLEEGEGAEGAQDGASRGRAAASARAPAPAETATASSPPTSTLEPTPLPAPEPAAPAAAAHAAAAGAAAAASQPKTSARVNVSAGGSVARQ